MKPDPIREDDRVVANPREVAAVRTLEAMGFTYEGGDVWTRAVVVDEYVWSGFDHSALPPRDMLVTSGANLYSVVERPVPEKGRARNGIRDAGSSFGGRSLDRSREP